MTEQDKNKNVVEDLTLVHQLLEQLATQVEEMFYQWGRGDTNDMIEAFGGKEARGNLYSCIGLLSDSIALLKDQEKGKGQAIAALYLTKLHEQQLMDLKERYYKIIFEMFGSDLLEND